MTKGYNKTPDPESQRTYDRAEALTFARGCVPENPCWSDCLDAARSSIIDGNLDEWEKEHANTKHRAPKDDHD